MPKMKTNRAAMKRFRTTGTGKIRKSHSFTSHILTKKKMSRKRKLRKAGYLVAVDVPRVRKMILA